MTDWKKVESNDKFEAYLTMQQSNNLMFYIKAVMYMHSNEPHGKSRKQISVVW